MPSPVFEFWGNVWFPITCKFMASWMKERILASRHINSIVRRLLCNSTRSMSKHAAIAFKSSIAHEGCSGNITHSIFIELLQGDRTRKNDYTGTLQFFKLKRKVKFCPMSGYHLSISTTSSSTRNICALYKIYF